MIATLICTAANVAAARAAQAEAGFTLPLSGTGTAPATHYASHGKVSAGTLTALSGLCDVTTGTAPAAVLSAANLKPVGTP